MGDVLEVEMQNPPADGHRQEHKHDEPGASRKNRGNSPVGTRRWERITPALLLIAAASAGKTTIGHSQLAGPSSSASASIAQLIIEFRPTRGDEPLEFFNRRLIDRELINQLGDYRYAIIPVKRVDDGRHHL